MEHIPLKPSVLRLKIVTAYYQGWKQNFIWLALHKNPST